MTARAEAAHELTIPRTFKAPVDVVFSIWAEREHVMKWWGPKAFETTQVEWDFRIGGAYRICIVSDQYGKNWMSGRFVDIVQNERIVFTFSWESGPSASVETLISVTFVERDGATTQSFHQTPFLDADARDRHIEGWNQVFDREQAYAEGAAKNQ